MQRKREQMGVGDLAVAHQAGENAKGICGQRYRILPEVMLP